MSLSAPSPNRPRPLAVAQGALLLLAFYRGFRTPNLWSLNYYQLSWADGFFRRGLLGTLLLPLGCARFDPRVVWVIQFAVLAGLVVLLLRLARGPIAGVLLCLFLASDMGGFLFHEVGYPEQLLLLVEAACAALLARGRPRSAAALMALSVLAHEMALFVVAPFVLLVWVGLARDRRPRWALLAAPTVLTLALMLALSRPMTDALFTRYAAVVSNCGGTLWRPDFLDYYKLTARADVKCYFQPVETALLQIPLLAGLAAFFLSRAALPSRSRGFGALALAACAAPLLLGWLGTDTNRWAFLAAIQAVLAVGMMESADLGLAGGSPLAPKPSRMARLGGGIPLALVLLALHVRYFDGLKARPLDAGGLEAFPGDMVKQWSVLPRR